MEGENTETPRANNQQPLGGRAEEIAGVVEHQLDRLETRYKLKVFHDAINEALRNVGEAHGFTLLPAGLRFNGILVTGRITFVLKGKEAEVAVRAAETRNCGLSIGDIVIIKGQPEVRYRVAGFGHVNVKLERITDGRRFLAKPRALERVSQSSLI